MDSESGVDYHYIFLSFRSCIIHDMIENLSCIFRCLSAIQINILITGEAEAFGSVNLFMITGCHFKLIGQRNLIISVKAMNNGKFRLAFLISIGIEAK